MKQAWIEIGYVALGSFVIFVWIVIAVVSFLTVPKGAPYRGNVLDEY